MSQFDPYKKEQELRTESASWNTADVMEARSGDIPVVDLTDYFQLRGESALQEAATSLRDACENVGFFTIIGHQVDAQLIASTFEQVKEFHSLLPAQKNSILMDRPDWPVGGVGYLPVKNRKLPARESPNFNEAFLIKHDHRMSMDDNQWPDATWLPQFRQAVESYATAMETLAKRMLPIFATALSVPSDYFDEAFVDPFYRLRMTHYPPLAERDKAQYGIAPHVDTTFCTILAQDSPGLMIFSEPRQKWIKAPMRDGAFIVNTGELLRQWTNDRFISVKHFANNNVSDKSRYSIPFFFNANSDYTMRCIPTCCGPDNPPKYPPVSYAESQAVAQGE